MAERLEESLREKWKFTDVRPHQIESLLTPEADEKLHFFLDGYYASRYLKLKKVYGLASQGRRGRLEDDDLRNLRIKELHWASGIRVARLNWVEESDNLRRPQS